MLEVGATGSIVKAAGGDPVRQSQYSRQIKELEDFFRVKLIERSGRGMQLTPNGKELARISRFFLLGLSNFQRGCLAEEQTFRIGASATFLQCFVAPTVAKAALRSQTRYVLEVTTDDEIEKRLHDLTLDFGIVSKLGLSRPLQIQEMGRSKLGLYVPKSFSGTRTGVLKALRERTMAVVIAQSELNAEAQAGMKDFRLQLACDSFLNARAAMAEGKLAGVLPEFLAPDRRFFWRIEIPEMGRCDIQFSFAWNPRLIRLNPRVIRTQDALAKALAAGLKNGRCA